jgi:TrmH family RNA methyltransferase
VRRINSRQNPVVTRYRDAARGADDALLLDGVHLAAEALHAGIRVRHAAVRADAADRREIADLVRQLEAAGAEVVVATAPVMDAISPVRSPSPVVALADRPAASEGRVYERRGVVIVAVDVQDPGNLGAIVRVAEAAGAAGVVAAGTCADPFGWKALRGSMGSALRVPIHVDPDAAHAADVARRHACRVIATAPRGGRPLFEADLRPPVAVLIGGEGQGLAPGLVAGADERLTIPMQPPVESLNAAVAAALIAYEATRRLRT